MTDAPTWKDTVVRATAAAIPYPGGTLQVVYEDVRARRAAAAGETLDSIVRITGEPALAQRLATDPNMEALFVNAVDAAIRTGMEDKRRLLARVVATAVEDEAKLDDSVMLADVLSQLDTPHVKALKRLATEWEETLRGDPEAVNVGGSEVWGTLPAPVRAVLVRTGMALPPKTMFRARSGPHRQVGITDDVIELVRLLKAEVADDPGPGRYLDSRD